MARAPLPVALVVLALTGCGGDDGADRVDGNGYAYDVPDGWQDRSGDASDITAGSFRPDTLVVGDAEGGFTVNINVLEDRTAGRSTTLDRYVAQARKVLRDPEALRRLGASGLEPRLQGGVRRLELGGDQARSYDYTGRQQGRTLRFRQVYAVRGGTAFVITYTAPPEAFEGDAAALEDVIGSWKWD